MKQVWEKIVEGILTCSGFITSITIVLIVIFLFTGGIRTLWQQGNRRRVCAGCQREESGQGTECGAN